MKVFCDCILPCVVGKAAFRESMANSTSLLVAATDVEEAFALLVLENIWPWWKFKPLDDDSGMDEDNAVWANSGGWGPIEKELGEDCTIEEGKVESDEENEPGAERGKAGYKKENISKNKVIWPGKYTIDSVSGGSDGRWSLQGLK